jgi:hypothetical protein
VPRRIISIALVAIGLVLVALAVGSATLWRAPETVTAALPQQPEAPLVVTAPGVLDLVADRVSVRATAPDGAPVVLALGREQDVSGWVGDAAHVTVTGLGSWTELETSATEGPMEVPSPAGSDLWIAEATGDGEAEMSWVAEPGRWSLLAASDGRQRAPVVELTWNREVATPLLVPGLVIGALLVLAGVALAVVSARRGRAPSGEASGTEGDDAASAADRQAGRGRSGDSGTQEIAAEEGQA